jgi:hypothetical protein
MRPSGRRADADVRQPADPAAAARFLAYRLARQRPPSPPD